MAQVIWTEQATEELINIAEYLSEYSAHYAKVFIKNVYQQVTVLQNFPLLGRVVPEIGEKSIREIIEGKYRVIYELMDEDIILIQRVFHSSRDLKS